MNMGKPALTVIIPVYRVEDTLDRCIQSVVGQAAEGMEIILVDDGSDDSCPQRCDEWARQDERILVVHQPNGGLSKARNAGLDIARGDYITFVDSDDYIEAGTYPALLRLLQQHPDYDLLEFPYEKDRVYTFGEQTYEDVGDYWLRCQAYSHTFACNKIYRRALFDEVRFPKGMLFEDAYTLPLLLKAAKRVATTETGRYHYTINPKGITATADGNGLAMLLNAHLGNGMPMDERYYMHLLNIQMDVYELTDAPIKLSARRVSTQGLPLKMKAKAILNNTIGIRRLCRLNKALHKIRNRLSASS